MAKNGEENMTGLIRYLAAVLAVLLLTFAQARAEDNVKLALNWLVSGKNAPYFVAQEKGFYKAAGLNVAISRGNGSGDTVKRIAVGESEFGLADTATVISAQTNDNSPVKMVGMMFAKSSIAILYNKDAGISKPADLIGKKLGRSAAGASVNMYPAFLKANKIERSQINEVVVSPSTFLALLLSKQVDAVLDQSSYLGRYRKGAAGSGATINAFRFADFGLDLYGDGIIVQNSLIQKNPDLIKRFMAATLKGSAYSFEHPDEAIDILRKTNPEIDHQVGKEELIDTKELAMTDEVAKHGLGYIDADHMKRTQQIVIEGLNLKSAIPLDTIYTLTFLPPGS
jgi:NitT/TauT family transport system substrate-binding protein